MPKRVQIDDVIEIKARSLAGHSTHWICNELGVSAHTVRKYRDEFLERIPTLPLCGCGRPVTHAGVCSARRREASEPADEDCDPDAAAALWQRVVELAISDRDVDWFVGTRNGVTPGSFGWIASVLGADPDVLLEGLQARGFTEGNRTSLHPAPRRS